MTMYLHRKTHICEVHDRGINQPNRNFDTPKFKPFIRYAL